MTAAESITIVSQELDNWLVEQVGVAVIAVDPVGVVLRWNREAERIYGWPAANAVGAPRGPRDRPRGVLLRRP